MFLTVSRAWISSRHPIARPARIPASCLDFESVCTNLFGDWVDGFCCPDVSPILQEVRCEDCDAWVREILAPERLAISVLRPSAVNV